MRNLSKGYRHQSDRAINLNLAEILGINWVWRYYINLNDLSEKSGCEEELALHKQFSLEHADSLSPKRVLFRKKPVKLFQS
ncbi:MAG: hypothetical protein JNK32_11810 [Anaerolineales bacterium]|nr:hypothetical protein [Anaerolineales bacterium]